MITTYEFIFETFGFYEKLDKNQYLKIISHYNREDSFVLNGLFCALSDEKVREYFSNYLRLIFNNLSYVDFVEKIFMTVL